MLPLPDDAYVVRGGLNTIELLKAGSGVTFDSAGNLFGLSVNNAPEKTVAELSVRLRNRQIGVNSAGDVRAAGGEVQLAPNQYNPCHCLLGGISAQTAHNLLNPSVPNPSRVK